MKYACALMRPSDNPFNAERLARVRYVYGATERATLLRRFEAMGWRGSIVGGEGRGKSTLRAELEQALEETGFTILRLEIHDGQRSLAETPWSAMKHQLDARTLVSLDGAEQLGWIAWARFLRRCRKAGGLLITSHRAGLLPTLIELHASIEVLEAVVDQCLAGEALPPELQLNAIYEKHGGDLRQVLRELYDFYSFRSAAPGRG